MIRKIISIISLLFFSTSVNAALIQQNNLEYRGAFRVPQGNLGGDFVGFDSLSYGGRAVTYNPDRNSLIMGCATGTGQIVEVSIPTPVISEDIDDLNTATVVQVPSDITEGNFTNVTESGASIPNGCRFGGFLYDNNILYGSVWAYYDDWNQAGTHFTSNPDWVTDGTNFSGYFKVGINVSAALPTDTNAGWTGGYMAHIPSAWQTALGAPALTGLSCISIATRTSYGPSIATFDPTDLGSTTAPSTRLIGYPDAHQTLNCYCDDPSLVYNRSTAVRGVAFPTNYDSVLFFGRIGLGYTGLGDSCYGAPTLEWDQHLQPNPDYPTEHLCFDLDDTGKGSHAYPYVNRVWAYDAQDLADVVSGSKEYWEVVPYAYWNLPLRVNDSESLIRGAAYDSSTQRVYLTQIQADTVGYATFPIVHVFEVTTNDTPAIAVSNSSVPVSSSPLVINGTTTPNVTSSSPILTIESDGLSVSGTNTWTTLSNLVFGANNIIFTATDNGGEISESVYTVVLTTDAITTTLNLPADFTSTSPAQTTFTASAPDGETISSVTSTHGTVTITSGAGTDTVSGTITNITVNDPSTTLTVTANASDGSTGTDSITITLQVDPPVTGGAVSVLNTGTVTQSLNSVEPWVIGN